MTAADPPASRLQRTLAARRFAFTAELSAPASFDATELVERALPLHDLADAVNVTDCASARTQMSALAAAALLLQHGVEPVLQLTCRDRNRIALQADLIGAAALGIRNLLMLRGDDPSRGDQPEAKAVFDLDTRALTETAALMRDRSMLPNGRAVSGRPGFYIGAADTPIEPPDGWRPESLERKLEAGAQFVQTQFCMDAALLRRYLDRLAEHGLRERLPMLIGVAPIANARSARWMRANLYGTVIPDAMIARLEGADDPRTEGRRMCVELIHELAALPGVAGVHVMAPLNEPELPRTIDDARRLVGAPRP